MTDLTISTNTWTLPFKTLLFCSPSCNLHILNIKLTKNLLFLVMHQKLPTQYKEICRYVFVFFILEFSRSYYNQPFGPLCYAGVIEKWWRSTHPRLKPPSSSFSFISFHVHLFTCPIYWAKMQPELNLVVAATRSLGIGAHGTMPWKGLRKEMAYFARVTTRVTVSLSSLEAVSELHKC